MGDRANVEPPEHRGRERNKPDPEPIAAARRDVLDEPGFDEGGELAGRRARARAQAPRDLVRAERRLVGEDVEDRE